MLELSAATATRPLGPAGRVPIPPSDDAPGEEPARPDPLRPRFSWQCVRVFAV